MASASPDLTTCQQQCKAAMGKVRARFFLHAEGMSNALLTNIYLCECEILLAACGAAGYSPTRPCEVAARRLALPAYVCNKLCILLTQFAEIFLCPSFLLTHFFKLAPPVRGDPIPRSSAEPCFLFLFNNIYLIIKWMVAVLFLPPLIFIPCTC